MKVVRRCGLELPALSGTYEVVRAHAMFVRCTGEITAALLFVPCGGALVRSWWASYAVWRMVNLIPGELPEDFVGERVEGAKPELLFG